MSIVGAAGTVYQPRRTKSGGLPALPSLTGMRYYAAFAVFLFHMVAFMNLQPFQGTRAHKVLAQIFPMPLGSLGVAFFFLLSGFIIDWSFRDNDTVPAFYRRRVLKIFPSHLVTAVVAMLVLAVPRAVTSAWLPNFFLVQTWSTGWQGAQLNVPSWSLCSEMLFYFLFPPAIPLIRRIRGSRIWWTIGGLMVALTALHVAIYLTTTDLDMSKMMSMMPSLPVTQDFTWHAQNAMYAARPHHGGSNPMLSD